MIDYSHENRHCKHLSDDEKRLLTPGKAKEMEKFDRKQERRDHKYLNNTVIGEGIEHLINCTTRDYAEAEQLAAYIGSLDLTKEEKALAGALALGATQAEIAANQKISQQAVSKQIDQLKIKLEAKNEPI